MKSTPGTFKLEIIPEPAMPANVDQAIKNLLCDCFPPDIPIFSKTRYWHGTAPDYSLVCRSTGQVIGHVGIVVRAITAEGRTATVAGIQNLAVSREWRKTGLSGQLMTEAMEEARRRGIPFGLLFCVPGLAKFYASLGWETIPASAVMIAAEGKEEPIPAKNITMVLRLGSQAFPPGLISLQGMDW